MLELPNGSGQVAPSASAIAPFRLHRPTTIRGAVDAMAGEDHGVYALGTTDVIRDLRFGSDIRAVVSLRRVAELAFVGVRDGELVVGAGVTHAVAAADPTVAVAVPGLAAAWSDIATGRVRVRATLGGNVMARRYGYELSGMLDALQATLSFADRGGRFTRTPAELWRIGVPRGALFLAAHIPAGSWLSYDRSLRPGVAVAVAGREEDDLVRCRAVITTPAAPPAAVEFAHPRDELADAARDAAARLPDAIGDSAGSARYRRRVASVSLVRLLSSYGGRDPWSH